jgi:polysaccharide biosynthesis transport protein
MHRQNNEQYRKAALALANTARDKHCQSVIVSSAVAGEGVTTATVFIARHLLHDLASTPVVIELNHMRPAMVRLFDLDPGKSMASVASGTKRVTDCVQRDPTGLSIIPAGEFDDEGGFPRLETVLCQAVQELQNQFNFILLDAPPVLESADTLIAGRVVPNVMLVVGTGRSSQEAVREACREMRDARMQIMGTILNETKRILPRWLDRSMRQ